MDKVWGDTHYYCPTNQVPDEWSAYINNHTLIDMNTLRV